MKNQDEIILTCSPLSFYTQDDEEVLFSWLKKIQAIKKCYGVGMDLCLHIDSCDISDNDLLNLMGIFDRYDFDEKQLEIFKDENNKEWFN
jgi:hypothetical protein